MPHPENDSRAAAAGPPASTHSSSVDWGSVLEDIGGDEDLLRELVQAFVDTYRETLKEIRVALDHDDLRTVSRAAHKLKGAASNFGLGPAYDAARNLEVMAVEARLTATHVGSRVVEQEFDILAEKLQAHFRASAP